MFDNLEIINDKKRGKNTYAFVGIQRNEYSNKLEFWLPHGFEHFPDDDFNSKKKLFFRMYKTFRKFLNEHKDFFKKTDTKKDKRDGVISEGRGGFVFKRNEGEEIILYSKLNMIDSILDGYDELRITALLTKNARSETIDYSKIDKYMHKAIYLPNHVIYIDEMMIPRKILESSNTDLIDMYCFIYLDIKESLEEDTDIPPQIKALAQNFKEKYLTITSSLFEEETSERTINTLKEVLAEIDRNSAYKDDDYWHFFDAIEAFLYGTKVDTDDDDGNYWGINNFSYIWEAMCHHYMFKNFKDEILYADSEDYATTKIGGYNIFLRKDFDNPFVFQLNDIDSKKHYLRPDLVHKHDDLEEEFFEKIKKESYLDLYIIKQKSIVEVKNILSSKGFEEDSDFFSKQLKYFELGSFAKGKKLKGRKLEKNVIYINKKNYEEIISDVKQRIFKNQPFKILDYKYEPLMKFEKSLDELLAMQIVIKKIEEVIEKIKTDIKKQLIYEYALQLQNEGFKTTSQFWIPYYFDDKNDKGEFHYKLGKEIKESRIEIFKANFMLIQEKYLEQ